MISGSTIYLATHITDRLIQMLQGVRIASGSRTDIGQEVLLNEPVSQSRTYPCVVLNEGPETGQDRAGGLVQTEIEYSIACYDQARHAEAPNHPDPKSHHAVMGNMIADVRELMEPAGCGRLLDMPVIVTYNGAVRYPVEEGGDVLGVELRYSIAFAAVEGDFCNTP